MPAWIAQWAVGPTTRRDAAALANFLGRVFRRAEASLLDEKHMAWKYWTARPDWKGSRSFTARHRGAIVAHAAVWPLAQALTAAERNWKLPVRLLQGSFWRLWRPLSLPRGWSATPLAPEEVPEGLWPRPTPNTAVTARGPGFYRYFADSPFAQHVLFGLQKHREPAGYFCLAFAPHAARIADLWLPSTNVEDWCAGFRTAAVVAASQKGVHEVSAWASTALGKEGLSRAGFLLRRRSVVSLFGDAGMLDGRELHLQMLDSDASSCMGKPCPPRPGLRSNYQARE